jgi:mannose-1-phosphate guanylyltransferase
MKALVLSAGIGERLRPLTNSIPKPLLELGGRPLIHYALLMLSAAGIVEVAVNLHHLAAQVEHALGDGRDLGLKIIYSREAVLSGTGGPLIALRDYFGNQPFLILNSDTIMDLDMTRFIERHRDARAIASLVLRDGADSDAYSRIEMDDTMRIRRMRLMKLRARAEFEDYPTVLDRAVAGALRSFMYCGAMLCEPEVLSALPPTTPFSLVADVMAPLLVAGSPLFGFVHQGFFRTVDDLKSYAELRAEFASSPPPLSWLHTR